MAFRHKIKLGKINHESYFPKEIIRNEFSLQEQEKKKEKWRVFSNILDFIHCFDEDFSPLGNAITKMDRINKLMINFLETMETMNEKKTKSY